MHIEMIKKIKIIMALVFLLFAREGMAVECEDEARSVLSWPSTEAEYEAQGFDFESYWKEVDIESTSVLNTTNRGRSRFKLNAKEGDSFFLDETELGIVVTVEVVFNPDEPHVLKQWGQVSSVRVYDYGCDFSCSNPVAEDLGNSTRQLWLEGGCFQETRNVGLCGNGKQKEGEACDIGQTTAGNGCYEDATGQCVIEEGWTCLGDIGSLSTCTKDSECGNRIREGDEVCDNGLTDGLNGCNATCTGVIDGWTCAGGIGEQSTCSKDAVPALDDCPNHHWNAPSDYSPRIDPTAGSWETIASMPTARYSHDSAALVRRYFVVYPSKTPVRTYGDFGFS